VAEAEKDGRARAAASQHGQSGHEPAIVVALRECKLFRDLDDAQLRTLASVFRMEEFEAGACIFRQGDLGSRVYLIAEGQVGLERSVNVGSSEAKVAISLLGKHRLLGCWACLLGEERNLGESAVCQKPTRVVSAAGADLEAIMESNPRIAFVLLKRLCFMLDERLHDCYCAMGAM
jgi:CRP/FNR family cyclic AMP-dependent transcriptional regulator